MVNKAIILVLLVFSSCARLLAQDLLYEAVGILTDNHSVHKKDAYSESSLYLTLTEEKEYNLILSLSAYGPFDGVHKEIQISYGNYYYLDTTIYLLDAIDSYITEMKPYSPRQFIITKGLSLTLGKIFNLKDAPVLPPIHFSSIEERGTIQTDALSKGRYMNRPEGSFELIIQDSSRYEYFIDGILISNGIWHQKENYLSFKDDDADVHFRAFIDDDGKITSGLPGNPKKFPLYMVSGSDSNIYFGDYQIDINSEQVNCELRLGSDFSYEIQLCFQETEDMVCCAILSYGHYSCSNEHLILHDDFFDYDWELFIKNNIIKTDCGFSFLDRKRIVNYNNENVKVVPPDKDYLNKIKSTINSFSTEQGNPQISPGHYEDLNQHHVLYIESNGDFQLYLKDVPLSNGHWKQQNKVLVLHDKQLNHDFTLAIGNGKLMSNGIPGEFGGTMLQTTETLKENTLNKRFKTPQKKRRGG